MFLFQNSCIKSVKVIQAINSMRSCRTKTTFSAFSQSNKYAVDMSYASYQNTESALPDGGGTLSPLIILHGILGSKSNFKSFSKKYHASVNPPRQVVAVDLRNHGDSYHSKDHSYDGLVIDVLKFMEKMAFQKACLIGHEMGGRVGMLFALKYPELVEKLIVVDASPITTSSNFNLMRKVLETLNQTPFPPNVTLLEVKRFLASRLSSVILNKSVMNFIFTNIVVHSDGSFSWRFNVKSLLTNFEEMSAFPDIHNITYSGPVLFVGGAKSDYIQKSDFPKILKLFPNAKLQYIEGAGHWVHSEKPKEFLNMTLEFLNKNVAVK